MQSKAVSGTSPKDIKAGITQSNKRPTPKSDQKLDPSPDQSAHSQKYLPSILETQKKLKEAKARTVIFSPPIISHKDKPIIYPRTINVAQGQAGSFKSRVCELICSTLLWVVNSVVKLEVFTASLGFDVTVCYVDTERNLTEQLPYALQSIQTKAGFRIDEHPERFDYISLMAVPRKERFNALREYLDYVREKYKTHIFIVLDVLTDCCQDFNRTDDSMELIDFLNLTINQYDVTFLCIIHENPGSAKARGHLGTELNNKASSVMQIGYEQDASGKDTDLIRVKFLKCRNTRKHDPFYLKYCDEFKGLVLANEVEVNKLSEQRKAKAMPIEVAEKIEKYLSEKPMKGSELVEILTKDFNASERTIEERLKEIVDSDTGFHVDGKPCQLIKGKVGRNVSYSLMPRD